MCFSGQSINKMAALASDWFGNFRICSKNVERNSTKLTRKEDLNVLYQVCVFQGDRKNEMDALAKLKQISPMKSLNGIQWNLTESMISTSSIVVFRADQKNKMAAQVSDLLKHFRLLLWNLWTEFNETWQEAKSQRPVQSLSFSGRSGKQDGHPCFWLAETLSTFTLKSLKGNQRNLTKSKISISPTSVMFFFRIDRKNKIAVLSDLSIEVAHCTRVHDMWPIGPFVNTIGYIETLWM